MKPTSRTLFAVVVLALVARRLAVWVEQNDVLNDCEGGTVTSLIVGALPVLSIFLHARDVLLSDIMEGYLVSNVMHLLVPNPALFNDVMHTEPDYDAEHLSWNALPHTEDTGDIVPNHCGAVLCSPENQKDAPADLFFIGPSTHYSPFSWNVNWNSSNTRYMNREAIIPQQAAIFNSVARVYVPQIRQMTGFGYLAKDRTTDETRIKAANIAYSDARKAFKHYLNKWNPRLDRPIILAGHSQGAEYMLRLLRDEFSQNKTLMAQLVVAFIVGMPVYRDVLEKMNVPACASPTDAGCVVSWQTYVDGADPRHFYFEPIDPGLRKLKLGEVPSNEVLQSRLCINPLNWRINSPDYVDKTFNLGGMHIIQLLQNFYFLSGPPGDSDHPVARQVIRIRDGLLPLKKHITGARCVNGSLYVDDPPRWEMDSNPLYMFIPVWRFASFPGSNLHPYDYNFFWADIRKNAEDRVAAFIERIKHRE